jgi:hypothetical protein
VFVCEVAATGLPGAADKGVAGETWGDTDGRPPGAGVGVGCGGCNAKAAVPTARIEIAKAIRLYLIDMLITKLNLPEYLTARY